MSEMDNQVSFLKAALSQQIGSENKNSAIWKRDQLVFDIAFNKDVEVADRIKVLKFYQHRLVQKSASRETQDLCEAFIRLLETCLP